MTAIDRSIDPKSVVIGALVATVAFLLLDGPLSYAQRPRSNPIDTSISQQSNNPTLGWQVVAGDAGVYIWNVNTGRAVFREKADCAWQHSIAGRCDGVTVPLRGPAD